MVLDVELWLGLCVALEHWVAVEELEGELVAEGHWEGKAERERNRRQHDEPARRTVSVLVSDWDETVT